MLWKNVGIYYYFYILAEKALYLRYMYISKPETVRNFKKI